MIVSWWRTATIVFGLASLVAALVAVVTDQVGLVVVAAMLAGVSVALVVASQRRRPDEPTAPGTEDVPSATNTADEPTAPDDEERPAEPGSAPAGPDPHPAGFAPRPAEEIDLREPTEDCLIDPETGLFNQLFFDASLVKRVSAARRALRPLSVAVAEVVVRVDDQGATDGPAPAPDVARTMLAVLREADLVARADDGRYLILLEDTPENGAVWTLERLRRRLVEILPGHTVRVGVSCYPAYGFSAAQLVAQARRALDGAREWHQDRIEVTAEDPDD
jgi:diguanylate cyclase (GGDEF)-like protein